MSISLTDGQTDKHIKSISSAHKLYSILRFQTVHFITKTTHFINQYTFNIHKIVFYYL